MSKTTLEYDGITATKVWEGEGGALKPSPALQNDFASKITSSKESENVAEGEQQMGGQCTSLPPRVALI